ncbi:MAG: hypothetical protein IT292_09000 [Deltaproteobacteria bacterium]|nr:hypothetical protein [Deltaproteobacteria bacterium]
MERSCSPSRRDNGITSEDIRKLQTRSDLQAEKFKQYFQAKNIAHIVDPRYGADYSKQYNMTEANLTAREKQLKIDPKTIVPVANLSEAALKDPSQTVMKDMQTFVVATFQRKEKLPVTGRLDAATAARLLQCCPDPGPIIDSDPVGKPIEPWPGFVREASLVSNLNLPDPKPTEEKAAEQQPIAEYQEGTNESALITHISNRSVEFFAQQCPPKEEAPITKELNEAAKKEADRLMALIIKRRAEEQDKRAIAANSNAPQAQ